MSTSAAESTKPAFQRILLKLSGEALMGAQNYGIDTQVAESVAREIKAIYDLGIEIAIVVGGGNIFRGVSKSAGNMDRGSADYIGMLATVMNGVVLQDALERIEVPTRVMSAIDIPELAEPFIRRRATRHLEKKTRRDFCRRNRKSVFYDRFRRRPARAGNQGGSYF